MSEQYDECSDSARFNRLRWAAEWCTWLARRWRGSAPEIHDSTTIGASKIRGATGRRRADGRLTAGKVLLDQSMPAGEPVPQRIGLIPLSWSCRFVAGSGPADLAGGGSAFVPQIALLIAAATANRRVLASGHDLQVIPVTLGVSSWKVSRQRLRPASSSSLPISRISTRRRHCRLVKPGRPRRPHLMKSPEIVTLASSFLAIADVADQQRSSKNSRGN